MSAVCRQLDEVYVMLGDRKQLSVSETSISYWRFVRGIQSEYHARHNYGVYPEVGNPYLM